MLESLGLSSAQVDLLNAIAFQLEIGGSSKTYKNWSGIDLAVSVATGAPWLDFEPFTALSNPDLASARFQ